MRHQTCLVASRATIHLGAAALPCLVAFLSSRKRHKSGARCATAPDHRPEAVDRDLRYTSAASVRQNPRTTRLVVAIPRATGRSTTRRES